jgi:hypothetical protein
MMRIDSDRGKDDGIDQPVTVRVQANRVRGAVAVGIHGGQAEPPLRRLTCPRWSGVSDEDLCYEATESGVRALQS